MRLPIAFPWERLHATATGGQELSVSDDVAAVAYPFIVADEDLDPAEGREGEDVDVVKVVGAVPAAIEEA